MKKHPNVGSKVETTIKYDYAFTLGEYEKYLISKLMKKTHLPTDPEAISFSNLKRVLKGNRTVFKNWTPAPTDSRKEAEDKMNSVINFLSDKNIRENILTMLKNDLNVDIRYDKYNQVTSLVTDSVSFENLPTEIKSEVNKSITKFKDLNSDISIVESSFDKDIDICKSKNIKTIVNKEEFINSSIKDKPDFFDQCGRQFEEKVNNEVDKILQEENTKFHVQTTTYWLFWFIPIWITREIVTLSNPK